MNEKISVTIITLNEEKNIKRAIVSAKLLTENIVVIDSGSDDNTCEIAKKLGAEVFHHEFSNYADQKNYAAEKASGEWIFSLDADEEITPQLANEIREVVSTEKFAGFLIPRRNIILGREIKHSRWSPDKHIWLWKKNKGKWIGKVHEEIEIDGAVGEMKNGKLHYQDETIFEFMLSLNQYTQIEAEDKYSKGSRFSLFRFLLDPFKSFIGRFFLKQGYLDGWRGFVLCSLRAFYYCLMWLKILELQNRNR